MGFLFVFFMLFFVLLKAVVELSPLLIAVAALRAANEYRRRGECNRVEVKPVKPSRLRAALKSFLHP